MKKKRSITLIEMIIVMLLIGTITAAIAYNYNESLNEGKVFRTKQGMERIRNILYIHIAENPMAFADVESNWKDMVKASPLCNNFKDLVVDGWGNEYIVKPAFNEDNQEVIEVSSKNLERYLQSKGKKL